MRHYVFVRDAFLLSLLGLIILAAKDYLSPWWIAVLCGVYGLIMAIGAIFIRLNFFIPSLHHGDRNSKQIALSFDDGPAAHTAAILDILRQEGVEAAFFCIGKRVEDAPQIVQRMHAEGHIIGNHSYGHSKYFDWKDRNKMVAEITQTNSAIQQIIGKGPKLFRPPYGVTNPELAHAVNLTGMTSVGWSLRSMDTRAKDANKLLERISSNVRSGDVILLHDSVALTADILTALIHSCCKKGFTFVRLDHLLRTDAYA